MPKSGHISPSSRFLKEKTEAGTAITLSSLHSGKRNPRFDEEKQNRDREKGNFYTHCQTHKSAVSRKRKRRKYRVSHEQTTKIF